MAYLELLANEEWDHRFNWDMKEFHNVLLFNVGTSQWRHAEQMMAMNGINRQRHDEANSAWRSARTGGLTVVAMKAAKGVRKDNEMVLVNWTGTAITAHRVDPQLPGAANAGRRSLESNAGSGFNLCWRQQPLPTIRSPAANLRGYARSYRKRGAH